MLGLRSAAAGSGVMGFRSILAFGLAVVLSLWAGVGQAADDSALFEGGIERYHELRLKNGLRVVMAVDRRVPRVAVHVRYAVGDTLDPPDERGLARVIGGSLPKLSTRHVRADERALILRSAGFEYREPEVEVLIDATTLALEVPSGALGLVLWMEADRMGFGADGLHDDGSDIINDISSNWVNALSTTSMSSTLRLAAFGSDHPYAVLTGSFGVSSIGTAEVAARLRTYYNPANAALVLVGDFEPEATGKLIEQTFGALPSVQVPQPIAPRWTSAERQIELSAPRAAPYWARAWVTPPFFAPGDAELDVIANIVSRRLKKRDLCTSWRVYQNSNRLASAFVVDCTPRPGVSESEWQRAVDGAITAIALGTVPAAEIEIAKLEQVVYFAGEYQGLDTRARLIANAALSGNARVLPQYLKLYSSVDGAALAAAVRRHLGRAPDGSVRFIAEPMAPREGRYVSGFTPATYKPPAAPPTLAARDSAVFYRAPKADSVRPYTPFLSVTGTLKNGASVRFVAHSGMPLAMAEILVPIEDDGSGIAAERVLASLLPVDTGDGPSLEDELDELGATIESYAWNGFIDIEIRATHSRLAPALSAVGRALSAARFKKEDFERVRKKEGESWASAKPKGYKLPDIAIGLSAPRSEYRYVRNERRENAVSALTLAELERFWRRQNVPSRMAVHITGPFDSASALEMAEAALPKAKAPKSSTASSGRVRFRPGVFVVEADNKDYVEGVILWPVPSWASQKHQAAAVMTWLFNLDVPNGLGARMKENGAKEPWWQTNTFLTRYGDFLRYSFQTPFDQVAPLFKSLRQHMANMSDGHIPEMYSDRARNSEVEFLIGRTLTKERLLRQLYFANMHRLDAVSALETPSALRRVGVPDVVELARTLRWETAIIALSGPTDPLARLAKDLELGPVAVGWGDEPVPSTAAKERKP